MKIKIIKVIHCPGSPQETKSRAIQIKHKGKIVCDGFSTGPFFKTKKAAKEYLIEAINDRPSYYN